MAKYQSSSELLPQTAGVLVVNKPKGITSHDVVDCIRRLTGERRVGHAGTLDPLAEGVLIVLVGREATKRQAEFMSGKKEYIATIQLGATSDTDDAEGRIVEMPGSKIQNPSEVQIQKTLGRFVGKIEQIPPAYSAVKIGGVKAYDAARKGAPLKLSARTIKIKEIKIFSYEYPFLRISVTCSKGTYIRSLARDVGKTLGCGAYLDGLIRTRSGGHTIADAISLDKLTCDNISDYLVKIEEMP